MATNFPGGVDNFVNPTASDTLDSPDHASQHSDANDAIEAIETALLDGAPLHIDDVNERVGIGTATPESTLEVNGILTANHIHGNIAGAVYLHVKNTSGVTIPKGSPVYATGSVGGSGETEVAVSDADNAVTMPALGIVDAELVNNAEGHAIVLGVAKGLDTSTWSVNDSLYVSVSGGLTNVRPTGASELVQKIGRVIRAHASTGEILVLGAGRANDVPNNIVAGGLTIDTNTLHVDAANNRVGVGTTTPDSLLEIKSSRSELKISSSEDNPLTNHSGRILFENTNVSDTYDAAAIEIHGASDAARNGSITFLTNPTGTTTPNGLLERMIIDELGNVGIGTTSPTAELDVRGSSNPEIRIISTDSSDPFLYFGDQIDTVRGGIGYDTSANALLLRGYNNTMRISIDSAGHVTMPYQPCFYAYVSGSNRTHGAGWSVMSFSAELFDNNSDFNTATYRFVAPVTGKYQFNTTLNLYNVDMSTNATQFVISLYKNGVEQTRFYQGGQYTATGSDRNRSGSAVMSMSVNDYAEIRVYSADANYQLSASAVYNSFSGFLIG